MCGRAWPPGSPAPRPARRGRYRTRPRPALLPPASSRRLRSFICCSSPQMPRRPWHRSPERDSAAPAACPGASLFWRAGRRGADTQAPSGRASLPGCGWGRPAPTGQHGPSPRSVRPRNREGLPRDEGGVVLRHRHRDAGRSGQVLAELRTAARLSCIPTSGSSPQGGGRKFSPC